MKTVSGWEVIPVPPMQTLSRAVFLRSQALAPRQMFPLHTHTWHQFVYAISGTLVVRLADSRYVITPQQAIWLPAGLPHASGSLSGAEFRNLYIEDLPDMRMPKQCTMLTVSPLLRALIIELSRIETEGEEPVYADRIDVLVIDQLHRLKTCDLHLPWPQTPLLGKLCEALYESPGDDRSAEHWSRDLGISARTLARRFESETGMTLRDWRYRLRLFRAVEWLGSGASITDVALELGYASSSAFAFMFRKEMGSSPTEWLRR